MNTMSGLKNTGWDWLLKTYHLEDLQHLYIEKYGNGNVETTEFLAIFKIKGNYAVIIDGRIHEDTCDIYYNKEGESFILTNQYNKLY